MLETEFLKQIQSFHSKVSMLKSDTLNFSILSVYSHTMIVTLVVTQFHI
jgi:hypothetical protein